MKTLVKKLRHFLRQCGGPTAVEYAVLLVLVIFGAMTAVSLLGENLSNSLGSAAGALPSGGRAEASSESSQDEEDDKNSGRRQRRRRGKSRRRPGGRRSSRAETARRR